MSYIKFEKALMTNLDYSLQREILRTNRSGAYACSTIVDCNTGKYHGLLTLSLIHILCVCVHLYSLSMHAQEHQTLRSQLKEATEVLACYPDSVDLRLKKAALNLQLEQWQYAKDEYDQVLRSHPDNIAGLYYRAYANQQLSLINI